MTNEELGALLLENNRMLREICGYIRTVTGRAYREQEDMRQFFTNVAADIFVEAIEGTEEKETLLKTIKR